MAGSSQKVSQTFSRLNVFDNNLSLHYNIRLKAKISASKRVASVNALAGVMFDYDDYENIT